MSRSRRYAIAAALAVLLSLANVVVALVVLPQGSDKVNSSSNQPPYVVLVIEVLIGVLGVVAAYGVLRVQRWGVVLTLGVMIVNVLISLPGIPFGPTFNDKAGSVVAVVVSAVVIWLLLRRESGAELRSSARV
jgi:hypothetical protein